jgi:hypothetical protein
MKRKMRRSGVVVFGQGSRIGEPLNRELVFLSQGDQKPNAWV